MLLELIEENNLFYVYTCNFIDTAMHAYKYLIEEFIISFWYYVTKWESGMEYEIKISIKASNCR